MRSNRPLHILKTTAVSLLFITPLALQSSLAADQQFDRDRMILSFSTVGDSRQDPATPDPTTLPLSGQDAIWLQNTRALDRISRSVEIQRSSFLFFNGDMIMGYGNAVGPADTNVATVVN